MNPQESMMTNLLQIRQTLDTILAGSGINVNAQFTIDDKVGINDVNGNQITPLTAYLATGGTQSGVTVSVTPVLLAGSNPLRKSIVISHIGTSGVLYLGPSSSVASGMALAGTAVAAASAFTESAPGLYTGTIWGIMDKSYSQQSVSVWDRV